MDLVLGSPILTRTTIGRLVLDLRLDSLIVEYVLPVRRTILRFKTIQLLRLLAQLVDATASQLNRAPYLEVALGSTLMYSLLELGSIRSLPGALLLLGGRTLTEGFEVVLARSVRPTTAVLLRELLFPLLGARDLVTGLGLLPEASLEVEVVPREETDKSSTTAIKLAVSTSTSLVVFLLEVGVSVFLCLVREFVRAPTTELLDRLPRTQLLDLLLPMGSREEEVLRELRYLATVSVLHELL